MAGMSQNARQFRAVSQGRTEEKALDNIRDAISHCLAVRAEEALPLSDEVPTNSAVR